MVKNSDLERVGKDVLKNILRSSNQSTRLADNAEIQVDEEYRIRMMSGSGLIYVYDFTKNNEEGLPTKELYNRAVHNTEMMHEKNPKLFEEIVRLGIIDERFGYYVTKIS